MRKHLLRAAAMAAILLPGLAPAATLSLDQAIELAVQRSEAARAARAGVASAGETARASGQLPDPMLRAGVENLPVTGSDRFRTTRDFQTMKRIGIAQEWVSSEKRAAREAAARTSVAREAALVQVAAADTRLQTVLAYLDAYYAGEAFKLGALNERHAREELEAGKGRLAAPGGNSTEVLALTSALGLAADESADLRQQQSAAALALRRWVGLQPDELAAPDLAGMPSEARYVATHPSVVAKQRDVEVARREVEVARLNRRPSWTWEVSYGQRTGYSDMVSVGVSIPLAVAPEARQDRETASRLALVEKAEAELAEAERTVQGEYATLTSDAQKLQLRIERFREGVIVPARQRTAASTAAYRANQASLVMLFEARHAEVELQRKLLVLQRDLAKTQAQLTFKPIAGDAP